MKMYPTKTQWKNWTLPSKAGYLGLVIAVIGIPLWIVSYMTSATKENQEKILRGQEELREEIRDLKNATLRGDKQLVEQFAYQINEQNKLDFQTGSNILILVKELFFNGREFNLLIKSKENNASIRLFKDSKDYIRFIYSYPTIGEIVRGTQITPADIEKFKQLNYRQGIFMGFTWNLKEARTTLYINGRERN